MSKHPNLFLGIALAVVLAISAFQGELISRERVSQDFYRWILSAAETKGRDGQLVPNDILQDVEGLQDDALFDEIATRYEDRLPEPPESDLPSATEDASTTKLVSAVRSVEEGETLDRTIWDVARGPEMADLRKSYAEYRTDSRLYTAGTQLGVGNLWGDEGVTASLGSIFFGFRKMAANLLWLQCDSYFHSGENHLLIPTMRTVVALDPQFVDAYLIGAWHMAYNITAKMEPTPEGAKTYSPRFDAWVGPRELYIYEGIELLKTGIRNNPRNYKLYFDLGFTIYAEKLDDYKNAALYLKEAIRYRHEPYVARVYYRILMQDEQFELAREGWNYYLTHQDANFEPARRLMRSCDALQLQQEGDQALERVQEARENNDAAAEAAATQEMKQSYNEAREVWAEIIDQFGEDPFGESRMLLMRAQEYVLDDRYIEAIALLEQARTVVPREYAMPLNDLMIDIKLMAGYRLNLSERMQIQREKDAKIARELQAQEMADRETAVVGRGVQWPLLLMSLVFMAAAAAAVVVMARSRA